MQAGRLPEAERLCRQSLAQDAPNPERFHFALGFIFMGRRELDRAAQALRDAVAAAPRHAEAWHALGFVYKDMGKAEEALAALMRAAECPEAGADIHCNLGLMHLERGEGRLAIAALRRAVALDAKLAGAWQALGTAHRALNEVDDALAAYRHAVACDRQNARVQLALGTLLLDMNRSGAVEALGQAARLDPRSGATAERHARALAQAGRFAEALAEHERARRLAPDNSGYALSQAETLAEAGRQAEADKLCQQLIEGPKAGPEDKALAHQQLAIRALARGDAASARRDIDAAVALAPARDDIRLRRAMLLLSLGQFDPGWREFRSRFSRSIAGTGGIHAQPFPQPLWSGEPLGDRTILVWGEQGIGDDIVAASMLPDLASRAREVWVHTDARLQALFTRSFAANLRFFPRVLPVQPELLSDGVSCQIAFGGLGEFLRPSWESFGAPRAYLCADPGAVASFRHRHEALPGLKVGISWRSRNLVNGRIKSTKLDEWEPILRLPGVTFVNLQYGDCTEELARAQELTGGCIHQDPEIDQLRDMDSFAAQVASLDLVISVSNAIAHTAGSLGVPTWVLLATDPLWLWFRDRDDSPWYPRVRLFRQARAGDWSEPVSQIASALRNWPR